VQKRERAISKRVASRFILLLPLLLPLNLSEIKGKLSVGIRIKD
jgi:hypothetical protein